MIKKISALISIIFIAGVSAFALEDSVPLAFSLEEAWQQMENSNAALRTLEIDRAAALREIESLGCIIPGISVGTGLSRSSPLISSLTNPANQSKTETDYWSLRGSIDVRLNFTPGRGIEDKIKALELNLLVLQTEARISALRGELEKLYYQIIAGEKTIELQEQTLSLTEERLNQVEAQYARGLRSDLELLSASIAVARDKPGLKKALIDQEKRLLSFREYLGLETDTPLRLTSQPGDIAFLPEDAEKAAALIPGSREILMLQLQLEIAELNKELSRTKLLSPSLGMSLGWSSSINPVFKADFWTAEKWDDNIGLGLSLSIPIDSRIKGSSADLSLQKINDTIAKLKISMEESRRKLETKVQSLLLDLELSQSNLEANELNVSLQEQNYLKVKDNFESGRISLLELDNGLQELQKARIALENEKLNRIFIIFELRNILGLDSIE